MCDHLIVCFLINIKHNLSHAMTHRKCTPCGKCCLHTEYPNITAALQHFCFLSPLAQTIGAITLCMLPLKCGVIQCLRLFYLAVSGSPLAASGDFTLWINNNVRACFFEKKLKNNSNIMSVSGIGGKTSVIYCLFTQPLRSAEESSHNVLSENVSARR